MLGCLSLTILSPNSGLLSFTMDGGWGREHRVCLVGIQWVSKYKLHMFGQQEGQLPQGYNSEEQKGNLGTKPYLSHSPHRRGEGAQ